MGLLTEEDGFPRIAGRIIGVLLLAEGPYSLDELAEVLQVSKASVSTNARSLERIGLVERSSEPGDRRDYYQISDNPWAQMFALARRRIQSTHDVLAAGFDALPPHLELGRRRLEEWRQFYAFMLERMDTHSNCWLRGDPTGEGAEGIRGGRATIEENS
jgi:DNA-binding MarR family transcriptional regulator